MKKVLLLALMFSASSAVAHDFYDLACCSDKDCAPLPAERVSERQGGWQLSDGRFVAFKDAKHSPDGQFHLCESAYPPKRIICFYAPPNSF